MKTNDEMNEKNKSILKLSGENYEIYARQRIIELEEKIKQYEQNIKEVMRMCEMEEPILALETLKDCFLLINKQKDKLEGR